MIARAIIACLVVVGCSTYYTIGNNVQVRYGSWRGNHCAADRGPQISEIIALIHDKASELSIVRQWPPKKLDICLVDRSPFAVCGSVVLGGCAWPDRVFVPLSLAETLDSAKLRKNYVWQNQLAHEIVGALTLQGVLILPLPESALVQSAGYKAILEYVRENIENQD